MNDSRSAPEAVEDVSLLRAALLGGPLWVLLVSLGGLITGALDLAEALLLVGPLVTVPLGLRAIVSPGSPGSPALAWVGRAVGAALLPAAVSCGCALVFVPDSGPLAAGLVLPWVLVTGLIGLLGLVRLRGAWGAWSSSEPGTATRLPAISLVSLAAGPLLLPVGGAWLLASRAGIPVLGFAEPWPLLTAAHVHFAGFALPILAGLAARALPGPLSGAACAGVLAGVPLVAAGITLSRTGPMWPEWLAGWLLAGAGALVAVTQLRLAWRMGGGRGLLLAVSGLALLVGLSLAAVWSLARGPVWGGRGVEWLSLGTMVRTHAPIMVCGFALPGLLAWTRWGVELRWSGAPPRLTELEDWERRQAAPAVLAGPGPGDHHDAHVRTVGFEPPGPPLPDEDPAALSTALPTALHRRAAAAVLAYDVFPRWLLRPLVRRAPVQAGDTLGGLFRLGPGLELRFASRVIDVFDRAEGGAWRTGFTYRTLPGHPEEGEETFAVEKDLASGRVQVALRAWSRPGAPPVRALAPLGRLVQRGAGKLAVRRLARRAHAGRAG